MKVILLTGASSGIGYQTAEMLAKQGHKVYGAARRVEKIEPLKAAGVTPLKLDVTDEASIKQAVDEVIAREGRIDVLINNAGYGSYGPVECVPIEEAKRQMEVNVFGVARLIQLVLPYMRKQGSGRIISTSSIGGQVTSFMGAWYHASKYALVSLLRMGSGKEIHPERVESPYIYGAKLEAYLGVKAHPSNDNQIVFRTADMMLPFITQNNIMWEYLEPELKNRLALLSNENSFTGIVEKRLFSAIPSGKFSRDDIAKSLGVSVRTLQRNLSAENTTFNQQVQAVQKRLAFNYLHHHDLTTMETACLVGYQDQTAFSRAFKKWTGKTITEYKALKKSSDAVR